MNALFPLAFASEEVSLLTAVVLGFLFGFTLERAGFGNARKLAAQFYLYDMTVFKVMFTAILVAMVGIYGFAAIGWVDLSLLWINETFLWSQLVGGFLLGVGFILSGLCPGTAAVSAASGRLDALVAFAGIFLGTFLFAVALDVFPWLERLYTAGSLGTSLLQDVLGIPAPLLAALVVLGAGLAFIGAEWVERVFARRHAPVENAPTVRPRLKFAVPAVLALVAVGATVAPAPEQTVAAPALGSIAAGDVARRIIARDPGLLLLDVRPDPTAQPGLPMAQAAALDSSAHALLSSLVPGQLVVLYDEAGTLAALPAGWPTAPAYALLQGGLAAWRSEVLTPAAPRDASIQERERIAEQNQLAAFFSGARAAASSAAAPPPAAAGGAAKKKKAGGC